MCNNENTFNVYIYIYIYKQVYLYMSGSTLEYSGCLCQQVVRVEGSKEECVLVLRVKS